MTSLPILEAAQALAAGHLVAFPTETVFGLGADAFNPSAVSRVFEVKGRPSDHPLIVHISDVGRLGEFAADVPDMAAELARAFWPGPMTLILRRAEAVPLAVTGGQDSVGVRVPRHSVARELLRAFERLGGLGVAAPSANRFGRVSPTTSSAVFAEIGAHLDRRDVILDGERSEVGIESTIIDCTGSTPFILRPGAITRSMVESVTQRTVRLPGVSEAHVRVSGTMPAHYAPDAVVLIDAVPTAGDGLIALNDYRTPEGVVRLAAPATPDEYARDLYAALRAADAAGLSRVIALSPDGPGIAEAIRDRLRRASYRG